MNPDQKKTSNELLADELATVFINLSNNLAELKEQVSTITPQKVPESRILDFNGTTKFLGVTDSFLRKQVLLGTIPYMKFGRSLRFKVDDLENWIQSKKR